MEELPPALIDFPIGLLLSAAVLDFAAMGALVAGVLSVLLVAATGAVA